MGWNTGGSTSKKYKLYLFLVIAVALALRLIGIGHGFPFIFNPDEPALVRSALGLRFDLNPGHFDWPHLFFYLNYFLYMGFAKMRGLLELSSIRNSLPAIVWDDNLVFYLISRIFAAFLGALTVIPVFMAARKMFGEKCGFISALVFAFIPFHVLHSHYALIDVPMTFFLAWALYFSARIYVDGTFKDYGFAGLFVGLSSSTKYNGALGILFIVLASIHRILSAKEKVPAIKRTLVALGLSGLLCIAAFVAGTPFSVLDYDTFLRTDGPQGALWQFRNVGKVGIPDQFRQFLQMSVKVHPSNLGVTFWMLYVAGFFYVLTRMRREVEGKKVMYVYVLSVFFFLYVSGFEKTRSHYFMVAYPVFALAVGYIIDLILTKVSSKRLRAIILFLVFLSPLAASLDRSLIFVKKDTRVQMYEWLKRNVSTDDVLVYEGYEGEALDPVFTSELMKNAVKKSKSINLQELLSTTGYLILSNNGDNFVTVEGKRIELPVEPVEVILNDGRRGPVIEIFRLPLASYD
ncbi:MAG: glycosyltransferase family 39 protein [Patescibacteria group bacterium]|jgi:hypothetical protein